MSSDFLSQNDFNAAKIIPFFVLCKFFAVFFIRVAGKRQKRLCGAFQNS